LAEHIIGVVSMGKPTSALTSTMSEAGRRGVALVFSSEAVLHAMMTRNRELIPRHTIVSSTPFNGVVDVISECHPQRPARVNKTTHR
jgi:hypothetical protein